MQQRISILILFENSLILKMLLLIKHLIHQIDGFRLLAVNDL